MSTSRIDLLHFWDQIALPPSRTPYITTFEDVLPRDFTTQWWYERGFESLCSKQCRRLIAFSECAKMHQTKFNKQHKMPELNRKLTVLLPPQSKLVTKASVLNRKIDGIVRFGFIGKAFFRKGGKSICRALARIRKQLPIELIVIGDIDYFDYASNHRVDDCRAAHAFFEQNSSWAHYYRTLPNVEALEIIKSCHVGLLPTRDDTFGYSVLEMQALGLPCLTTDIWSLPEINTEDSGWIIHLKKNDLLQADYFSDESLQALDDQIENGIFEACSSIFTNRESLIVKGLKSLERIELKHSPESFGRKIRMIYEEALA